MAVDLEQIRTFYRNIPLGINIRAYSYVVFDDGTTNIVQGSACHGGATDVIYNYNTGIHTTKTVVVCSGGILPSTDQQEVVKAVWRWATGRYSPWRTLFPNGVELILRNDGTPCGWLIEGAYLKDIPFSLMKNFMIFTRSLAERYSVWEFWHELITKHGMRRSDAAFLITRVMKSDDGYTDGALWNGGHWPFTDKVDAPLSVKRLLTGDLRDKPITNSGDHVLINYHFCADESRKHQFYLASEVKFTTRSSRFGPEIREYKIEDIIASYYAWNKKHGK